MITDQEVLERARNRAGISFRELAEASGLSLRTVYRALRDPDYIQAMGVGTLEKINEVLIKGAQKAEEDLKEVNKEIEDARK